MFSVLGAVSKSLVLVAALTACAPIEMGPAADPPRAVFRDETRGKEIVLDLARMRIERDGQSAPVEDCSNAEYFCLRAADWFAFAYPRSCPSQSRLAGGWSVGGFTVEYAAPSVHRPAGSGLYFSRSVPGGQFLYDMDFGLAGITFSRVPPHDREWQGANVVYSRGYPGRNPPPRLFACSPEP
jgi:hypothetical protein